MFVEVVGVLMLVVFYVVYVLLVLGCSCVNFFVEIMVVDFSCIVVGESIDFVLF